MELRELPPGGRGAASARLLLSPGAVLGSSELAGGEGGWVAGACLLSATPGLLGSLASTPHPHRRLAVAAAAGQAAAPAEAALGWGRSPGSRGTGSDTAVLAARSLSLSSSFLCSSHMTWDSVLLGLRHLFEHVLGPLELLQGC